MNRRTRTKVLLLFAAIAALAGAVGAAASSSNTSGNANARAETLIVAADPALLPYQFYAKGTRRWQGINIDIGKALSKQIGRKLVFKAVPFDSIIPGLQAKRYDLALTGMFDTKDREKVLDFVDYLKSKNSFLLRRNDSRVVRSFDDLCGVSVGLNKGSFEVQLADDASKKCRAAGKDEVDGQQYPDMNANLLALQAGRVDVVANDSATNAYVIKTQPRKFKQAGAYATDGYFAAAVIKGSPLLKPLFRAFRKITARGELRRILKKWGIVDRAMAKPLINKATF